MSRRWQKFVLCGVAIALLGSVTSAILFGRVSTQPPARVTEQSTPARSLQKLRNLSLQPEAAALNRRLGQRFKSGRERSVLTGNLIQGGIQQPVTIIRTPTDSGEAVEVLLAGRRITWSGAEGIRAVESNATEAERLFAERLVFDSPDQFVLAQLRGASYQTIVRNLRPTDAPDDYAGPLWTMVRINDPQAGQSTAAKSPWRLYFINSQSGLIDRVESDLDGQRVAASFLQWTEQNGEKIPSHIRWTSNGETLMEYQLAAFSLNQ
jgi:hypothetical protein